MKVLMALTTLPMAAVLLTGADATYIAQQKVADTCAKSEKADPALVHAPELDLRVFCRHFSAPSVPDLHEKRTHIYHVLDGSATIMTGGTLIGKKMTEPGEFEGTRIEGGKSYRVSKGDVIVLPAGSPHWITGVQSLSVFGVNVAYGADHEVTRPKNPKTMNTSKPLKR